MAHARDRGPTMLQVLLLGLVERQEGAGYGHALTSEMRRLTGSSTLRSAAVYGSLKRLLEAGYVQRKDESNEDFLARRRADSESGARRTYYRVTAKGSQVLHRWLDAINEAVA